MVICKSLKNGISRRRYVRNVIRLSYSCPIFLLLRTKTEKSLMIGSKKENNGDKNKFVFVVKEIIS